MERHVSQFHNYWLDIPWVPGAGLKVSGACIPFTGCWSSVFPLLD
ncbi:MAG: hypothetical protein AB1847_17920 [bacterium]